MRRASISLARTRSHHWPHVALIFHYSTKSTGCSCTQFPPPGMNIDGTSPLPQIGHYDHHLLVSHAEDAALWPSQLERDSTEDLIHAWSTSLKRERRLRVLVNRFHDAQAPSHLDRPPTHLTSAEDPPSSSSSSVDSDLSGSGHESALQVLQFPRAVIWSCPAPRNLTESHLTQQVLGHRHAQGARHAEQQEEEEDRQSGVEEKGGMKMTRLQGPQILICGHEQRDARCGLAARILKPQIESWLVRRGIEHGQVRVVSHLGGHKFAGVMAIYVPPSPPSARTSTQSVAAAAATTTDPIKNASAETPWSSVWYSRIRSDNLDHVLQTTIVNRKTVPNLVRYTSGVFLDSINAKHAG